MSTNLPADCCNTDADNTNREDDDSGDNN